MPKVSDFKSKNQKAKTADETVSHIEAERQDLGPKKRRPGRETVPSQEEEAKTFSADEAPPIDVEEQIREEDFEEPEKEKIKIDFVGSEFLRERFKTPFDVVETVATDWLKGGDFSKLPIQHPLARFVAQAGLRKAKEIETQVLEHPMTEKILVQAFTLGLKAQGVVAEVKDKLKKKG